MCARKILGLFLLFSLSSVEGKSILRKRSDLYESPHVVNEKSGNATHLNLNKLRTIEPHYRSNAKKTYDYSEKAERDLLQEEKKESFILLNSKLNEKLSEDDAEEDEEEEEEDNGVSKKGGEDNHSDDHSEEHSEEHSEDHSGDHSDEHEHDDSEHQNNGNVNQTNNVNMPYNNQNPYTALPPPPPPVVPNPPSPPFPTTTSGIVGHVVSNVFTAGLKLMGVA
ncbi:asparagine-rich protein (ARP) [Plasmodium ovale wallikeri]|uniref:Asparagine-rich protein (ARP) n=2 Tax=Plasmodium ovale TaxID=36330 RepID=A0A1A8YNL2_PLAOA|nr:asparagine-rich protein (ARP) [Plasmodium ovale wallikeri]SBT33123.1 asparagine-rich protein (ARP) [Plasmodium ovale wallikeri]SBT75994.1 asparagine-rich protein, putative [Plasmodium ovale]